MSWGPLIDSWSGRPHRPTQTAHRWGKGGCRRPEQTPHHWSRGRVLVWRTPHPRLGWSHCTACWWEILKLCTRKTYSPTLPSAAPRGYDQGFLPNCQEIKMRWFDLDKTTEIHLHVVHTDFTQTSEIHVAQWRVGWLVTYTGRSFLMICVQCLFQRVISRLLHSIILFFSSVSIFSWRSRTAFLFVGL